jgi:hypothetical protein
MISIFQIIIHDLLTWCSFVRRSQEVTIVITSRTIGPNGLKLVERGNYRSEGHPAPQLRMLASRTEIIDTLPRIVSKQWI